MDIKTDASTQVYGVIGYPISHSLSPVMHNAAFCHTKYNGVYLAFETQDSGAAMSGMRGLGIKGMSVTIPHKVAVMDFLDELDEMAQRIGAVNTVINRDGILRGYNSDWLGAVRALSEKTEIRGRKVAIIGAGGAARAIGFGIVSEGGHVTVVNRSIEKGESLAKDILADFTPLSSFKAPGKAPGYDILINTTPLGMTTKDIQATPVPKEYLEKGMLVMDIVYNPLNTRLIKEAREAGCDVIDGLAMFVYQGAFQFEVWTKKNAPVEKMRTAVLNALIANDL